VDLKVPYRDRHQRLDDPSVLRLPQALEGEERAVADHLLVEAMADPGLHTIGDLLDRIEQASPGSAAGLSTRRVRRPG
jgi:hypothetical protein